MKKIFSILFFIACLSCAAHAKEEKEPGLFASWFTAMGRTLKSPTSYDIYRPVHVHHMRWNYSHEQIARYNERPGGLGFGISRTEERIEHSLYTLVFTDSNYYAQGVFGYSWMSKIFEPESFFNLSYGFTLSLQMRHEYNYIPAPLPLPLAGIDAGPISFQGAYVPGWPGMGNVAIFWVRLKL